MKRTSGLAGLFFASILGAGCEYNSGFDQGDRLKPRAAKSGTKLVIEYTDVSGFRGVSVRIDKFDRVKSSAEYLVSRRREWTRHLRCCDSLDDNEGGRTIDLFGRDDGARLCIIGDEKFMVKDSVGQSISVYNGQNNEAIAADYHDYDCDEKVDCIIVPGPFPEKPTAHLANKKNADIIFRGIKQEIEQRLLKERGMSLDTLVAEWLVRSN
jgi:hypothetical protein